MRRALLLTLAASAYAGVLFTAILAPAGSYGGAYRLWGIVPDPILHYTGFFFLALILHLVFAQEAYGIKHPILLTAVVGVCLGIIGELLQLTQPSRRVESMDFVMNVSGALTYVAIAWIVSLFRRPLVHQRTVDES